MEYYHIVPDSVILVVEQQQQEHSENAQRSSLVTASFMDDLQGISIYLMVFLIGLWYFGITNPGVFILII